jgi:hypothetical protein
LDVAYPSESLPHLPPLQVRLCNWELEPFVFYALKKVNLVIGVREKFSQVRQGPSGLM